MEGRHQWRVVSAGNGGVLVLCWRGREVCWSCWRGREVRAEEREPQGTEGVVGLLPMGKGGGGGAMCKCDSFVLMPWERLLWESEALWACLIGPE